MALIRTTRQSPAGRGERGGARPVTAGPLRAVPRPEPEDGTQRPGAADRPPILTVTSRESAGTVVISLTGELDIATADRALRGVRELIGRNAAPVVLDLSCLTFCDASGLRALLLMREVAGRSGWPLHIAAPTRQVARIIRVAGIASQLPVFGCLPALPGDWAQRR